MPQNIQFGIFVLGGVLILIGILGGGFKLFGAEVFGTVSNPFLRFGAFFFGAILIIVSLCYTSTYSSSANGKYSTLIQTIECPDDYYTYGEFSDYGFIQR